MTETELQRYTEALDDQPPLFFPMTRFSTDLPHGVKLGTFRHGVFAWFVVKDLVMVHGFSVHHWQGEGAWLFSFSHSRERKKKFCLETSISVLHTCNLLQTSINSTERCFDINATAVLGLERTRLLSVTRMNDLFTTEFWIQKQIVGLYRRPRADLVSFP